MWEENNKHYDVTHPTGIPPHVVNFVNHDKVTNQINTKFANYEKLLTEELDKRQMGGVMSMNNQF